MIKLIKILVGFASTFVLISIFGGVGTAVQLYLFSIICTAGISLLLWVPVWFGVGSLVVTTYTSAISPVIKGETAKAEQKSKLTNDQKALTDYIHNSRIKGVNDNDIFSLLKNNGWAEKAIHEAFGLIETNRAS